MAVARINSEFRRINLALERETRRATKNEWRAYLDSENQALKSKCCEWIEGTIYIVEPLTQEHERFTEEVNRALRAQRGFDAYMVSWGSAVTPDMPDLHDYEPDKGYGPAKFLGAPFPPGVQDYLSWYTLIVEVGKSRGWGDNAGMLDWKASEWSQFPGVRYILCVAVTDRLATAEYKLYTTLVTFDSRELLGLPPGANIRRSPYLRARFLDPTFTLDLFEVLEMARRPWA
ncbi:hypothetical protein PHYSODRAFT_328434 [Phytophthora sojae]|uniref:Restriction endonuclease domain-containing protein n=1 Tax=Phytophthora sojae (strain P6497) TaxID=1094619 RepID=G4Z6P1_PHYSP|nr:hypothetical protein PHYSODRAFT_328434 [Phytophthora sojae]EGZ20307.1 hypothetical protein PHYSODRAFT_328434 [Phytophthora sojae]|eukprot:XP_009523024.1 hypothetical protein PHYSODRAFT_328434 [Phytophthora sojae]